MAVREEPRGWGQLEGVRYEIAVNVLAQLIAHGGRRIRRHSAGPEPDPGSAQLWRGRRDAWTRARGDLTPGDSQEVERILAEDGSALRSFKGESLVTGESRPGIDLHTQPSGLLPDVTAATIFRDDIAPALEAFTRDGTTTPVAVVLTGQPGAGKTIIADAIRAGFSDSGGAVPVDVDNLKAFHPALDHLSELHGEVAADLAVHEQARRWLDESLEFLVRRRANVVVEHGLRNLEVTDRLLARFAEAGYRIEAALVATPIAVSQLGVLLRYQEGHENGGGRDVDLGLQIRRYDALVEVAGNLWADPRVDSLSLRHRDNIEVFRATRGGGGWDSPLAVEAAFAAERERAWSADEYDRFQSLLEGLRYRMGPHWRQRLDSAAEAVARPEFGSGAGDGEGGL